MDHSNHEPGTVAECPDCQAAAYEPGWYKAMRAEGPGSPVVIPEAGPNDLEIVLPDLEHVRPDDEER